MPNAIYTWQDSSHSATYKVTKTGTYWVRAYFPDYNITTSSSITVIYNGECIKIPNVFTFINDNKNDYFVITNTEGWNVDLQVYSRWGNIVFQDADYKNNWDGKDNAKPLADGVYYYIIKATSQNSGISKEYKGSVTILR
ncbi:MAG: gliding motility-associated C-terminal domain-containing protein [Ignavibacteriae bacterium]|nr:gliding motility-associated C-terminal domain-containing protein [Ignavibacteriota bacterium]